MSTELKPCLYCGPAPLLEVQVGAPYYVMCGRCDARGPTADTQELAREAWNRRAAVPPKTLEEVNVRVLPPEYAYWLQTDDTMVKLVARRDVPPEALEAIAAHMRRRDQ